MGTHGMELMEVGSLQRHEESGMSGSAQHCHKGAPPAENLLGGLASKSLSHGRTGAGERHGRWGSKELEGLGKGPWQMINLCPGIRTPGKASTQSWHWARDLLLPLAPRPTETLQPLKKCYKLHRKRRLSDWSLFGNRGETGQNSPC